MTLAMGEDKKHRKRRIRALEAQLDLRRHVGLGDKGHMWLGLGPTVSLLCPGEP